MDTIYSNRIQGEGGGVRPLSTALKTLAVLDTLGSSSRPMRLPEVAAAMGLSRPTAYQRLLTLVEAGWVEQDEQSRYRLSMHVSRLAAAALEQADLGTRVQPILEGLVHETKETASLAVLDRGVPCIVSRVESDSVLRAEQKIGTTMSLEGSASGRILAAFADEATLRRLKEGKEELASEEILAAARADGYALSSGYSQVGVRAVAAPVFDVHGKCSATLSLVMPETRFNLEAVKGLLLQAARKISELQQGAR
ncbi:IclR family transcriptional regulator [Chelativorans sp. YIM 93263]|uniref:IclR family transcriptional regulator n=1 Tax=Chelativorans sp. YIM 93263 TaxID=2906648 RepID=UPI002379ABBC|nr:IclR family transcriptional regulator [Chelativorans sp. YIM 93263]